jgi:hypothetical protein
MQRSYAQIPRRRLNVVDLKQVFRFVAPLVREAAVKSAAQLNDLGIRYALAGGLASALTDTFGLQPILISSWEERHLNIGDHWLLSRPVFQSK